MKKNTSTETAVTKEPSVAYILKSLPFDIELHVKNSANAWWMDQSKVHKLFAAFGISSTIPEACVYANISIKQYKYFVSMHPEVNEIRKGCLAVSTLQAKKNISRAIQDGDIKTSMWQLSKKTNSEPELEQRSNGQMTPEIQSTVERFEEEMRILLTRKPKE